LLWSGKPDDPRNHTKEHETLLFRQSYRQAGQDACASSTLQLIQFLENL